MTAIADRGEPCPLAGGGEAAWLQWAARVRQWLTRQGLGPTEPQLCDVMVLLPFAAHLPLARDAWRASGGGWMPRLETVRTLLDRMALPALPQAGHITGEPVTDRLIARSLLLKQGWARDWQRRDARGFEQALGRLVDTAAAVARARAATRPERRDEFDQRAREAVAVPAAAGPGARERLLAALAIEWALAVPQPWTDALFEHHAPAWVATRAVTVEPLVEARLQAAHEAGVPVLWLDAGVLPPQPGQGIDVAIARDAETEAQWAAARVLRILGEAAAADGAGPAGTAGDGIDHGSGRGERDRLPVALIAQDRGLVRRVEALLARSGVPVADETGWKLSTTRAAAALMALLKACRPRASMDELLDGLKSGGLAADWLGAGPGTEPRALDALERLARRRSWVRAWPSALPQIQGAAGAEEAALALWARARDVLGAWGAQWPGRLPLDEALQRLRQLLQDTGAWPSLHGDAAGLRVLQALRLDGGSVDAAWSAAAHEWRVDLDGLIRWIDEVLEEVAFTPSPTGRAAVVVTPMARAVLRPFAAVVWPGVDDEHLGEPAVAPGLLGESALQALGLPTRAMLREQQWSAFCLLMASPRVHVSWRHADGERPLGPSPLLERWRLAHGGGAWPAAADPLDRLPLQVRLQAPPLPRWQAATLPPRLHATAYEALRACPYRFHAERLLGLGEAEELEEGMDARDYGNWLHAVLRRYHEQEPAGDVEAAAEVERLQAIAQEVTQEHGWDDDAARPAFLPYATAFAEVARRYVSWWLGERARGARVARLEQPVTVRLPALDELGMVLTGQLDRVDSVMAEDDTGPRRAWRILDYKTTRADALRERMKPLTEDTQLAFYAALLDRERGPLDGDAEPRRALQAGYLSLEDRSVTLVPHAEVRATASALLDGVVDDMVRIAQGEPLPALGEGRACEHCRVRGLCRRDHWEQGASTRPAPPPEGTSHG